MHADLTPPAVLPLLEDDLAEPALFGPPQPPVAGFPAAVVVSFLAEVVHALAAQPGSRLLARLRSVQADGEVWQVESGAGPVALYRSALGAPASVAQLEEVVGLGGRRFVAVGGAGALLPHLVLGHAVVVSGAVRDEGTSLHYLAPSRTVEAHPDGVALLRETLAEAGVPHQVALTWTTDAPYRETRTRVERRVAEGCATVEMEAAALMAAARYRGVRLAQLLYAGDTLAGAEWDHRDWTRAPVRPLLVELAARAAARWAAQPADTGFAAGSVS